MLRKGKVSIAHAGNPTTTHPNTEAAVKACAKCTPPAEPKLAVAKCGDDWNDDEVDGHGTSMWTCAKTGVQYELNLCPAFCPGCGAGSA